MKTNNLVLSAENSSSSFMGRLYNHIKKELLNKKYMLFAFFVPVILLSICFVIVGMASKNGTSILVLDANAQYVRFHEQLRDIILGNESFFYTFQRALGGEFLGYFTYYLASPFTLIVALFPKNMIIEAMTLITILKTGFSGLSFSIYLYKTRPVNSIGFSMFSVMYALCAYAIAYQSNYMWMDALIYLPLITLGIEALIKENKFKLFIVSLALAIWSNYYIGYMLCIFTFIYFVFFLCTHSKEIRNPRGESLHILKSILRYVLYVCVALLICAAILFSAVYSLSFGKAGSMDADLLIPTTHASFLEILAKMFIGTFGTFRPISDGGLPHLYAGTLLVILLPVFFISKKIKLREKIGYGVLCTVFLASLTISTFDIAWHGFSEPVWLSYRYSFIFTFIMLIMAYRGYEKIGEFKFKYFAIAISVIVGLLFILQMTVHPIQFINSEKTETNLGTQTVWITLILLIGYFLIFYFLKQKVSKTRLISIILCSFVCVEAVLSTCLCYKDQFVDAGWTSRSQYYKIQEEGEVINNYFEGKDDGLYRVESFDHYETNDPIIFNVNGVSEFVSTYNLKSKDFLYCLGNHAGNQSSLYVYKSKLIDSLLGIKYVFARGDYELTPDQSKAYNEIDTLENGYKIYENPYALSIAYAVNVRLKDVTLDNALKDSSLRGEDFAILLAENMLNRSLSSSVNNTSLSYITSELRKGELNVYEHSDTSIKGSIKVSENQFVFTTIPYDQFWQVYVDGERVDTFKCVDSMLAFDVSEGEHTVELKYVPMQWYVGFSVSLVGIIAFATLCTIEFIIKRKSKKNDLIKKELI